MTFEESGPDTVQLQAAHQQTRSHLGKQSCFFEKAVP